MMPTEIASDVPELADEVFARKVKAHLRELYRRTQAIRDDATNRLENAKKSNEHIGYLIKRKRTAEQLLATIERHGKRDVFLSQDDKYMLFNHYTEEEFIKHLSFYVTQYE